MLKQLLLFFLFALTTFTTFAQADSIIQIAKRKVISNYLTAPETVLPSDKIRVLMHTAYKESKIKNLAEARLLYQANVRLVDTINLYYSDYPKGNNFNRLTEERIAALLPVLKDLNLDSTQWNLIKQTNCTNRASAMELFHGFEIIATYETEFSFTDIELDTTRFDDFVVQQVLERNDWREMLIVSDLTGSMTPYIAQLFLWFKLNTIDDRIKQFVFFNDGNTTLDTDKIIGATGGIYQTKSKKYEEVEDLAIQCMLSGHGGDYPENDVEAILKGLRLCNDCEQNILIADNDSNIRDLKLLTKIDQPIRIILCGVIDFINPEYLNLARATGGSIHLMEQDLFDLIKMNEGEILKIGEREYVIEADKFVEVKRM